MVVNSVMSAIVQKTTLVVVSVRVTTRKAIALRAYAVADKNAANAPSVTRLDAEGRSIVTTPISPTMITSQFRQSTCSFNSGADSAVTISGAARKIE